MRDTQRAMQDKLVRETFHQREEDRYHHTYDEELLQYEYVKVGDPRSIEESMKEETAYNLSDLYIQQADLCETVDAVNELHTEMIADFTRRMAELRRSPDLSRPVRECMDYIYYHLHERIALEALAEYVSLAPTYLAALFKREAGVTIQQYVRAQRVQAAKDMLLYSDRSLTEIGQLLAFSSSSHFIRVFRQETGMTPKEFRLRNFRRHWS